MCVWSEAPAVVCTGGPCTQEEGVQVAPKSKELLSHQEEDVCMAQGPRIALPQLEEWRAGIADCYFADCCFADCYCCADCYFDDDTLPNPKKTIAPRRRCVCGPRPRLLCVLHVAHALIKKKVCRWHPRPKNCFCAKRKMCTWPKAQELLCHSSKNGGQELLIAILLIAVLLIAVLLIFRAAPLDFSSCS